MDKNRDLPDDVDIIGRPATHLALHGHRDQLATVQTAIQAGHDVLTSRGPTPCDPDHGCYELDLVIIGHVDPAEIAITAATAMTTAHIADIARLN